MTERTQSGEPQSQGSQWWADEIDRRLIVAKDCAPADRVAIVVNAYREATGATAGGVDEKQRVEHWLRESEARTGGPSLLIKEPRLRPLVGRDVNSFASRMAQISCPTCDLVLRDDATFAANLTMPIDVDPWSRQSAGTSWATAVHRQLRAANVREPTSLPVCISVVSVLPQSRRLVDVDNIVKGLLDALEGVLYFKDHQVQCLTSRRLRTSAAIGWYVLSARAVHPLEDGVVADLSTHANIVSGGGRVVLPP